VNSSILRLFRGCCAVPLLICWWLALDELKRPSGVVICCGRGGVDHWLSTSGRQIKPQNHSKPSKRINCSRYLICHSNFNEPLSDATEIFLPRGRHVTCLSRITPWSWGSSSRFSIYLLNILRPDITDILDEIQIIFRSSVLQNKELWILERERHWVEPFLAKHFRPKPQLLSLPRNSRRRLVLRVQPREGHWSKAASRHSKS